MKSHLKKKHKSTKFKILSMKTTKLILVGMFLFLASTTQAQVDVNVQIGVPPPWGTVSHGERYYYLPDVQVYYDMRSSMFIYQSGFMWVHRSTLPRRYRNYDLYKGYKVIVNDYHGDRPYSNFKVHRNKYRRGYHGEEQHINDMRPDQGRHQGDFNENNDRSNYHEDRRDIQEDRRDIHEDNRDNNGHG